MTKKLSQEEKKKRANDRKKNRKQQKAASKTVQRVQVSTTETDPPPDSPPSSQEPVNLCDTCAYEYGECEGKPKFASEEDDRVIECPVYLNIDTVPTFDEIQSQEAVEDMPWNLALARLDDFGKAQLNARAAEIRELAEAEIALRFGPGQEPTNQDRANILVKLIMNIIAKEGGPTDGLARVMRACDVEHLRPYPDCYQECEKDECDGVPADQVPPEEPPDQDQEEGPPAKTPVPNVPDRPALDRFETDTTDYGNCNGCETKLKRTAYNRYVDAIRCTNPRCLQYRAIVKTVPTGAR